MSGVDEVSSYVRQVVKNIRNCGGGVMMLVGIYMVVIQAVKPVAGAPARPIFLSIIENSVALLAVAFVIFFPKFRASKARRDLIDGAWKNPTPGKEGTAPAMFESEEQYLASLYQVIAIVQIAMLGIPAFLAGIFYISSGDTQFIWMMALMLVLLATRLSSVGRVGAWIEGQQAKLLEERQFGSI